MDGHALRHDDDHFPNKETIMLYSGPFDIPVRMRRNLKTKMGLCFTKGQVVMVRHSPEKTINGFTVLSEGWSAMHPLFEDGKVTIFIPLAWAERLS
jgi:hypothetical protein